MNWWSKRLMTGIGVVIGMAAMLFMAPRGLAKASANHSSQEASVTMPAPFVTDGTLKDHRWAYIESLSDEFNGETVDTEKWNIHPRSWSGTWSWRAEDVSLSEGKMELALKYQPHQRGGKTVNYTAGLAQLRSPILYGYFEAKIKGPALNPGAKAAFWLGGHAVLHDPLMWTEIDILETNLKAHEPGDFSIPHNVHVFIHPDAHKKSAKPGWAMSVGPAKVNWDPSAEYHVYGCEWTPKVIRMYVDGKLQGTIDNKWWHQPLYLMVQNTVQWPYRKSDEKPSGGFPNTVSVEYVRVWKSPSEVDPPATPDGPTLSKEQWVAGLNYKEGP